MYRCLACKFEFPLDDVQVELGEGACICVRCFYHRNGLEHPMPAALRKDVEHSAGEEGK